MSFLLEVSENRALGSRGDFALCYKISYPEKYSQSKSDLEELHTCWTKAVRSLPDNTIIVKSDIYEKKTFDASVMPSNTYLERANQRYFNGREYMSHEGYVFFVCPQKLINMESCGNPFNFLKTADIKHKKEKINEFISCVRQAADIVAQSRAVELSPMSEHEIYDYTTFYFNGFQNRYLTDVSFKKDHFVADDNFVGMFTICNEKRLPEYVSPYSKDTLYSSANDELSYYAGFLDEITLPLTTCSHIYNQIIILDSKNKHLDTLKKTQDNLFMSRFLDQENFANSERLKTVIDELVNDETKRLIRGCNNIIFWTSDKETFNTAKDKISGALRIKEITPLFPTKSRLKEQYLCSYFLNASCLGNNNLYITELNIATALFANNTNYKNDTKGIYLEDRLFNLPVKYDFWDYDGKRKKSRNFAIITKTGGGKSYTALHLFTQLVEDDTPIIIVDIGGSYNKFAKLLPEEDSAIIDYVPGMPIGINPFAVADGEEIDSSKIENVSNFVWTLIKKSDDPTELERTSMRKIISAYYANEINGYCWHTFYNFIKNNADNIKAIAGINDDEANDLFDITEFLHAGSDFISGGSYANLLSVPDNDLSTELKNKKLILFIMDKARESTLLLSVMLQAIYSLVEDVILKNRAKKGIVFFDEVAELLKHREILMQLAFYAQTIRKHNGALGFILQNINQLPENDISKGLLGNIETFIFLAGGNYRDEIARLGLTDHDKVQITSMRSQFSKSAERRYSELYIKPQSYHGNVYRIESPPESFYAFQTEGAIYDKMMQMYNDCQDMEKVIDEAVKQDLLHNI